MESKRENTLQTCLSEDERSMVVELAEEEGISVSAYIRRAVRREIKKAVCQSSDRGSVSKAV